MLHTLKVEIGGNADSTEVPESSHMHEENEEGYKRKKPRKETLYQLSPGGFQAEWVNLATRTSPRKDSHVFSQVDKRCFKSNITLIYGTKDITNLTPKHWERLYRYDWAVLCEERK